MSRALQGLSGWGRVAGVVLACGPGAVEPGPRRAGPVRAAGGGVVLAGRGTMSRRGQPSCGHGAGLALRRPASGRGRPGRGCARRPGRRRGPRAPTRRSARPQSAHDQRGRAGPVHRWHSLGQVRSAASLPPPYHTGPPSLPVSPGRVTAYPVTWPGFLALYRRRTSTPAWSSQMKNSVALAEAAAAVVTCRRSVTRGASCRPRGSPSPSRPGWGSGARYGRPARSGAARTAARRPGRRRGPGTSRCARWAWSGPAGPASPRCARGRRRGGWRPSARRHPPGRTGTARCGASRRARRPPTRRR